jgi:hypothetical protein
VFKSISPNWMFEWLDHLRDFEKIEFPRHTQQRFLSSFFHDNDNVGKGKAFVIKKIKEHIQPSTVNFRINFILLVHINANHQSSSPCSSSSSEPTPPPPPPPPSPPPPPPPPPSPPLSLSSAFLDCDACDISVCAPARLACNGSNQGMQCSRFRFVEKSRC